MTRIPEKDREMIEKAIYLPMVLTIFHRDLAVFTKSPFKLSSPYIYWVESTIKVIQRELSEVKYYMRKNNIEVKEINRDESFTMFLFLFKGYEEHHNYFNPRIRNKVEELMKYYLFERLANLHS